MVFLIYIPSRDNWCGAAYRCAENHKRGILLDNT